MASIRITVPGKNYDKMHNGRVTLGQSAGCLEVHDDHKAKEEGEDLIIPQGFLLSLPRDLFEKLGYVKYAPTYSGGNFIFIGYEHETYKRIFVSRNGNSISFKLTDRDFLGESDDEDIEISEESDVLLTVIVDILNDEIQ